MEDMNTQLRVFLPFLLKLDEVPKNLCTYQCNAGGGGLGGGGRA